MTERQNINGYSITWTQPYQSLNEFFQGQNCREIYNRLTLEEEIDALDKVDEVVQNMLTYPEAQCIIADIMMQRKPQND